MHGTTGTQAKTHGSPYAEFWSSFSAYLPLLWFSTLQTLHISASQVSDSVSTLFASPSSLPCNWKLSSGRNPEHWRTHFLH